MGKKCLSVIVVKQSIQNDLINSYSINNLTPAKYFKIQNHSLHASHCNHAFYASHGSHGNHESHNSNALNGKYASHALFGN